MQEGLFNVHIQFFSNCLYFVLEVIQLLKEIKHEKSSRKDFAKVGDFIEMPNLIKVQRDSYEWFVEEGLGEV